MKWVATAHIFTWHVNVDFVVECKEKRMVITVVM